MKTVDFLFFLQKSKVLPVTYYDWHYSFGKFLQLRMSSKFVSWFDGKWDLCDHFKKDNLFFKENYMVHFK